ncbi:MAG: carboxypeptidase-like regulatory domain-containing protein [Pseudomonadota bacterium]
MFGYRNAKVTCALLLAISLYGGAPGALAQTSAVGALDSPAAQIATTRTYALTGRLTSPTGAPLAGARVRAVGSGRASGAVTVSESDGRFRFDGLAAGAYRVELAEPADMLSASPVKVAVGSGLANRTDIVLDDEPVPGQLVGTVASSIPDQSGLFFAFVSALRELEGEYEFAGAAFVAEDNGAFAIPDLLPGTYRVRIDGLFFGAPTIGGPVFTEFFEDADTVELATDIVVPAGADSVPVAVNIGPVLDRQLAGTVSDSDGDAASGVTVSLIDPDSNATVGATQSGADGRYEFGAVARGSFIVSATDTQDRFEDTFFPGVSSVADAVPVDVSVGSELSVDFTLAPLTDTAVIEGVITLSYGPDPLVFGQVGAFRQIDDEWVLTGESIMDGATGGFRIERLPAGVYRLQATLIDAVFGLPTEAFFDGADSLETATDIPLSDGEVLDGIVFAAGAPAEFAIAGTVTDSVGVPLEGITVTAIEQPFGQTRATAQTDSSGAYSLAPLAPGSFAVQFRDPTGAFATEFFDDADSSAQSQPIAVDSSDVTGVDAQLDAVPPPSTGAASGLVTPRQSTGFAFVFIDAQRRDDSGDFVSVGTALVLDDEPAPWRIANLPPGEYRFFAADIGGGGDQIEQYFDGVTAAEDATIVSIDVDEVPDINFTFE